jgi:hypothetical protein
MPKKVDKPEVVATEQQETHVSKTLRECYAFLKNRDEYYKKRPEETKIKHAFTQISNSIAPLFDSYNLKAKEFEETVDDIRALNAATDKDGVLLTNPDGTFRYTPEGHIKCRNKIAEEQEKWTPIYNKFMDEVFKVKKHRVSMEEIDKVFSKAGKVDTVEKENFLKTFSDFIL